MFRNVQRIIPLRLVAFIPACALQMLATKVPSIQLPIRFHAYFWNERPLVLQLSFHEKASKLFALLVLVPFLLKYKVIYKVYSLGASFPQTFSFASIQSTNSSSLAVSKQGVVLSI